LAGIFLLGAVAWAQETPRPGRQPRQTLKEFYDRALGQADLAEADRASINQKVETATQAQANWEKEHAEELKTLAEKMRQAREDNDDKATQELRAKRTALTAQRDQVEEKLHLEVLGMVKDAAKREALARQILRGRMGLSQAARIRLALAVLELTADQKAQAEKILAAAAEEAAKAADFRAAGEVWRKATDDVKAKAIANEDKAKKFDDLLRPAAAGGMFANLKLTAEQQKKVDGIMEEARKKADAAQPDERRTIMREAMDKIRNEVLTEEQRKQLQERPAGPRAGGGARPQE
jgi:Spy/CpxP family protein refolding chaperone